MKNIYEQNLPCTFTEQLALYLYDEIAAAEKALFESHLQKCDSCANELADFTALRSSVLEWRETDFAPLLTPVIVLPAFDNKIETKRSWFESLRSALIFSPARAAFASLFVFLIFGAILWFVSQPDNLSESADFKNVEKNPVEEAQVQSQEEKILPTDSSVQPAIIQKETAEKISEIDNSQRNFPSSTAKTPNERNSFVTGKSTTGKIIQKNSPKVSEAKQKANLLANKPSRNDLPAIEDDEEDDDSLRLTDLLDEVGMSDSADQKESK